MTSTELRKRTKEIMSRFPECAGVPVKISSRLTSTAGQVEMYYNKLTGDHKIICLKMSGAIFAYPENEEHLEDTVLHEIAHIMTPGHGHGFVWYQKVRSIGGTGETRHRLRTPPKQRQRVAHVVCTLCGKRLEMGALRYRRMIRGECVYYHSRDNGKLVCAMAYDSQKVGEK